MKKQIKRLSVSSETLRILASSSMSGVRAGLVSQTPQTQNTDCETVCGTIDDACLSWVTSCPGGCRR